MTQMKAESQTPLQQVYHRVRYWAQYYGTPCKMVYWGLGFLRALAWIMTSLEGPSQEKRQLLIRMVRSIALCASTIRAEAMDKRTYRIGFDGAYRRSTLWVISAFGTISTDATLAIAGMMPLWKLVEVERRKRVTSRRTGLVHNDQVIDDLANKCQHEWTSSTKRRWPYRLIPNIEVWIGLNGPRML